MLQFYKSSKKKNVLQLLGDNFFNFAGQKSSVLLGISGQSEIACNAEKYKEKTV